jgi:hypothetical protein
MSEKIRSVAEIGLGHCGLEGYDFSDVEDWPADSYDLLLVHAQIILVAPDDKKFMGEFSAQNQLSKDRYFSYWLHLPEESFGVIDSLRTTFWHKGNKNSVFNFMWRSKKQATNLGMFSLANILLLD